jgi:hypothetical protein
MKRLLLLLLAAGCSDPAGAQPQSPPAAVAIAGHAAQETGPAYARRVLDLPADADDINVLEARWNGRAVLLVDYPREMADAPGEREREVVALWRTPTGPEQASVTTGEQEGGEPTVAAIGFANADRDPADEMIVILTWPVQHYDVSGTLYDIRILDDARPGQARLAELEAVSGRFGEYGCDCNRRDEPPQRFPFRTIAAVKAELIRLGY